MKLSRRKFISAAAPLAIAAAMPLSSLAIGIQKGQLSPLSIPDNVDPLSRLTWSSFAPYIGTNFTFRSNSGAVQTLALARMDDTRPINFQPTSPDQECFALTFTGSTRSQFVQDVYAVEHFALGSFSLLITVLGTKNRRKLYEAVINRIVG